MTTTLSIDDVTCDGCEDIVRNAIEEVTGVESVDVDRDADEATVEGDADANELVTAVDFAGYDAAVAE